MVETRDYAPFGETIAKAGTFAVEHRFTGQPQDDPAGGLYDYGARFYSAKWGRFASPDEMVQGFDSQGLNPFAYVLNAPTSRVDPTGNFLFIPPIALGILIVGGFLGLGISYQIGQDLAREHANASKAYPDGSSQSMAKWPHFKGTPGSTEEGRNEDGEVTQVRRYGPDGYPETDVDYTHDHGGGKPHAHDWGRPEGGGKPTDADRGEGRPIEKGDPGFE